MRVGGRYVTSAVSRRPCCCLLLPSAAMLAASVYSQRAMEDNITTFATKVIDNDNGPRLQVHRPSLEAFAIPILTPEGAAAIANELRKTKSQDVYEISAKYFPATASVVSALHSHVFPTVSYTHLTLPTILLV